MSKGMSERLQFNVTPDGNGIHINAGDWRVRLTCEEAKNLYRAIRGAANIDDDSVHLGRVEFALRECRLEIDSLKDKLAVAKAVAKATERKLNEIIAIIESEDEEEFW